MAQDDPLAGRKSSVVVYPVLHTAEPDLAWTSSSATDDAAEQSHPQPQPPQPRPSAPTQPQQPSVDDALLPAVPDYQKSIARPDGREDADYYRDVENITRRYDYGLSRSNPLNFMIRLSAESTAFYQGSGWRSYENYIGAPIFYPNYTRDMKKAIFDSGRVQQTVRHIAEDRLHSTGVVMPSLEPVMLATVERSPETPAVLIAKEQYKIQKIIRQEERRRKVLYEKEMRSYQRRLTENVQEVQRIARSYIETLVADMSHRKTLRIGVFVLNNILVRMYNQGIHIKESEFLLVRKAALDAERNRQSLLFLPCHKSHVDYLVISYIFYRLGIALPHIAAGDNLNIPVIGPFLKRGGAFFIRRTFGDDPLYGAIFKQYIENLLERGHNIEVFIEGTRSRMAPRFGILKIVLDAILSGRISDVVIVPMSIGYDKVIETETYVNELLGKPKERESLFGLLNSASLLSLKLGRIDIRFAKPYSLRSWMQEQLQARNASIRPGQQMSFDPAANDVQKVTLLKSLGYRVLADINQVSVVMPTALVGTILLTLRGRGVGREELVRRVTWLRLEILMKGGRVADFGGATAHVIVDRAVKALGDLVLVRKDLLEPVIHVAKRFELSLYRNQVIHMFLQEAIVAVAMYAVVKKGQTHRRISKEQLTKDVMFLSQLFKREFIFQPGAIESNMEQTLLILQHHGVIDIEIEDPSQKFVPFVPKNTVSTLKAPLREIYEEVSLPPKYFVRLSDKERSIGRENFDFYCFLIWPFVETYWLAAVGLFSTLPTPRDGGITERILMERIQSFAKTMYYEGDLGYWESINKETIKNAILVYEQRGIIVKRQPIEEIPVFKAPLYAVHPDYERESSNIFYNVFPTDALLKDLYDSIAQKTQSVVNFENIYKTRLWQFVEQIGKYRREGKHRRDNEQAGKRVLRLARIARVLTDNTSIDDGTGAAQYSSSHKAKL